MFLVASGYILFPVSNINIQLGFVSLVHFEAGWLRKVFGTGRIYSLNYFFLSFFNYYLIVLFYLFIFIYFFWDVLMGGG